MEPVGVRGKREAVAVSDPRADLLADRGEIDLAIAGVLDRGVYVLGPEVEGFEREFARFTGASEAVAVASGTDAVALALLACGLERGDEVITVSHTAVGTAAGIVKAGGVPVLVDIDPLTMTIDADAAGAAISERTRAMVPVHLYGEAAAVAPLASLAREHGLQVVEDCAQAHGTTVADRHVGTAGSAGAFSFYPTKNLGAIGEGGAVVTHDPEVAERVRRLRQYGWNRDRVSATPGWNSRLDEIQAAILRVKLRRLGERVERRRAVAARYLDEIELPGLDLPRAQPHVAHSYHQFVCRSRSRDRMRAALAERGIATAVHYPLPVHRQPGYARLSRLTNLTVTESEVRRILSLPMHPWLEDAQVDAVIAAVNAAGAGETDQM